MRSRRLTWARARRSAALVCALVALVAATTVGVVARTSQGAGAALTSGYWLVGTDGGVFSFGQAGFFGSTGDIKLNQPIVGMSPTSSGRGYWMVASDGGIFAFGDAGFYGSMGGKPLNKPIVAMATTRTGKGYWLVAADGGIFAFGDAGFFGSMGGEKLNKPIVDLATTPSGKGYWMTATDGGIFAFGDAGFFGSTGAIDLAQRIHAMAATPTGKGYWMVAGDGGIFAFGDAKFHGSAAGDADKRVIDISPSASGLGYYVTTSGGKVFGFGDAKHYGDTDTEKIKLNNRIATMAAMNGNEAPIAINDVLTIDEDAIGPIDLLANDRDPEGGPLSLRGTTAPAHGTASPVGRGAIYKPTPDFFGTDSFTYTVVDDRGETATGSVTITIKSVDDKPKANDDEVTILEDTPVAIPILANDTGLGDGLKSLEVVKAASHGVAAAVVDGTIRYTPSKDFSDPNNPDVLEYEVKDTDGDTSRAKVSVTILPGNDIPQAVDDDAELSRDGQEIIVPVLDNDNPGDGKPQVRLIDPATGAPTDGRVTVSGQGEFERKDGGVRFRPDDAFAGSAEVRYIVVDGDGESSDPATVRVSVPNVSPQAKDDSASLYQSQLPGSYRMQASDPRGWSTAGTGGDRLTYRVVDPGQTGEFFEWDRDGSFRFLPSTPPGTYTFRFVASDGIEESAPAAWVMEVKPGAPPTTTTTTTAPPPPPPA